jgi:hypothetical protein
MAAPFLRKQRDHPWSREESFPAIDCLKNICGTNMKIATVENVDVKLLLDLYGRMLQLRDCPGLFTYMSGKRPWRLVFAPRSQTTI